MTTKVSLKKSPKRSLQDKPKVYKVSIHTKWFFIKFINDTNMSV